MTKRGQIFKSVSAGRKIKKNLFDLSHEKKLSANMADLVPIYLQECVPGDKFRGNTEMLIRFAPMIAPVMHRINAYIHYFFVPNRLVWDNWKDFITGGVDGKNASQFPTIGITEGTKTAFTVGSLPDYFGIPPVDQQLSLGSNANYINGLPFRAYQLIYNEYYRDQTLTPEVTFEKGDTCNNDWNKLVQIRKRQWEKDYFTSAQIKSQRGDEVLIPFDLNMEAQTNVTDTSGNPIQTGTLNVNAGKLEVASTTPAVIDNIDNLQATVNDLRTSIVLQQWLEKNARAGSRYIEQILAHFNRRVPDYRLQRPEMIGGGKQTIMISEVLANFESAETALGKFAGHGISAGNQSGFKYTADEHGYIIGILSVLPRTGYYQGINKMWDKKTKFDFYFPEFAHLGEQEIKTKEVYFVPDVTDGNEVVFGYTPRFAEYRYIPDSVHGEFRTTLEFWHLARKFSGTPLLNNSFTEADPDTRIFAIQDESAQKLWIQLYNNIRAIRPMPVYGTPIL